MRLIDADELTEAIKNELWDWETVDGITATTVLKQTISDIGNQPTVDAEPIKHGRWTRPRRPKTYERFCSCCGEKSWYCGTGDYAYCPDCGAKMDEVSDDR